MLTCCKLVYMEHCVCIPVSESIRIDESLSSMPMLSPHIYMQVNRDDAVKWFQTKFEGIVLG